MFGVFLEGFHCTVMYVLAGIMIGHVTPDGGPIALVQQNGDNYHY